MPCPCQPHTAYPTCCVCRVQDSDVRPIDARCDRPFRNLSDVHRAGRHGLNATFPVGSVWEVGPFVEGVDPELVRVIPKGANGPAFTSGQNYSCQPEDALAKGKACWFIHTETIWTPHTSDRVPVRQGGGQPPHVLAPLTQRMALVAGLPLPCKRVCGCFQPVCAPYPPCCSGCAALAREVTLLREAAETVAQARDRAERELSHERAARKRAEDTLNTIRKAVR